MNRLLFAALLALVAACTAPAQVIVLDTFDGSAGTGILSRTTWTGPGNVVFNGTTITVGNTAQNDNGWGTTSAVINATGMNFITVIAQRDAGNGSPFFVVSFEDSALNTQIFQVSAFSFATGALTTVQIPISSWGSVNPADITGWTIGGGNGTVPFAMTFDNLALTSSAIPEPATSAALAGALVLGLSLWRRRQLCRRAP